MGEAVSSYTSIAEDIDHLTNIDNCDCDS